ncbi:sensor histidine kinase [Flavitalea antarctica]
MEVLIQQTGTRIFYKDLPSVEGSSILLYQLFYNLMNNAIKFARSGVPPIISIGSAIVDKGGKESAQIFFNDNGIGFDQEQAEKIFETFTRLHSKDKYEGTGLGLSLCKRIVERHGGSIQAKGRIDEGATFIISLPLKQTLIGI